MEFNIYNYPLFYQHSTYWFPKWISKDIQPADKVLMIGARVHGNEMSGKKALYTYSAQLFRYAHSKGVKLIVYPDRNPSGDGKRYNIDEDDETAHGNNDFLRYLLENKRLASDIGGSNEFKCWYWADDIQINLPPETRLMAYLLRSDPLPQIEGVVDLHQDIEIGAQNSPEGAYHYAYGDLSRYGKIVEALKIPILSHRRFGIGLRDENPMETDDNGFIVRHDGSWNDLMYRVGQSFGKDIHSITSETTGATPIDDAMRVCMVWITGIINLIAAGY